MIVCLSYSSALAQPPQSLFYFADKPLEKPSPDVVETPPTQLLPRQSDIVQKASGLVFQYDAFERLSSEQVDVLRNAILEHRRAIFAIGQNVPRNYVQNRLRMERKVGLGEKKTGPWKIIADGLYRDPRGVIHGMNVVALTDMSVEFVLREIKDALSERTRDLLREKSETWEERPSQEQIFSDPPYGKYEQIVTPHILRGGSAPDDYWYSHLDNRSIPGSAVYGSDYRNRFNLSTFDASDSLQMMCHDPTGIVGQNKSITVTVGCPGPKVQWQWNTGATRVEDKSVLNGRKATWEVDYEPNGVQAKAEHRWIPGLEVKNRKNQKLIMPMGSTVRWLHSSGRIEERSYQWSYPLSVDP